MNEWKKQNKEKENRLIDSIFIYRMQVNDERKENENLFTYNLVKTSIEI